mmetsp:Transcript_30681/g.56059  ORF Transcript_30681/g.56059 Transcript_30681/m.56059 type:complete len:324 (+) Transcript_30681:68-1039(+)
MPSGSKRPAQTEARPPSPSSSSSVTPASSPSPARGDEPLEDEDELLDEDGTLTPPHEALKGWPQPGQKRPPHWPPKDAELLSRLAASSCLPLLADGKLLRLSAVSCPQPKDPLLWRLLPLLREAIAASSEAPTASTLLDFVKRRLPAACLARMTETRLSGLVDVILERNVRRQRLLGFGDPARYRLPPSEDMWLFIPDLPGWRFTSVWIAWCRRWLRPREAMIEYVNEASAASEGAKAVPLWIAQKMSQPEAQAAKVGVTGDTECFTIGDVTVVGSKPSKGRCFEWRDNVVAWKLLPTEDVCQELCLELIKQCLDQAASTNRA